MPLEKKPLRIVPRSYVPPSSMTYKVKDNETWETIARAHGLKSSDLVFANFGTHNCEEINWYLHHYVGCTLPTHDGKNWRFSSLANPGIIHIPIKTLVMPPLVIEGHVPAHESILKNVWAGVGKSHSADLFVIGAQDLTAKVYNMGDRSPKIRNAVININGYKFGPGLGADVGAVFVIAVGYERARDMNGVDGDWDFDIALGTRLSDYLKDLKFLGKTVETLEKYEKTRYVTENMIKDRKIIKGEGIYTLPMPVLSTGLHLWLGYKFGDVSVLSEGMGVP
jgi:hypothetical protein